MKIVQVNKFFYPKGGSESYYFSLCDILEQAGHEIVHFSMQHPKNADAPVKSPYEEYFVSEVDFHANKSAKKALQYIWSSEAERKFDALLKDTQPDIIHAHNIAHQLTPSILKAAKRNNIPVVQTLHDFQLLCPSYNLFTQGSPCERCFKHKYWNAIKYKCAQDSRVASALAAFELGFHNLLLHSYERGVRQFITPSQFMYNKLTKWGWDSNAITQVSNFVEKERLSSGSAASTGNSGEPDDPAEPGDLQERYVAYVGRLYDAKGLHTILDAAALLHTHGTPVKIKIIGTGPQEAEYKERVQQENLTNVEFLGFRSGRELDQLVTDADAMIISSILYENSPMVGYESLALGTPIIGANIGGIPELIQEGTTGYIFEPGDAEGLAKNIKMLYDSPLPELPKNQFTAARHLQEIESVYNAVLTQS